MRIIRIHLAAKHDVLVDIVGNHHRDEHADADQHKYQRVIGRSGLVDGDVAGDEVGKPGGGEADKCYEVSHHFTRPCDQVGESCPLKHSLLAGRPQRVLHLHQASRGEEHVDVELTPIYNAVGEIEYFVEMMHTVREASAHPSSRGLVGRSVAFNRKSGLVERVVPSEASVMQLGGIRHRQGVGGASGA